MTTTYHSVFAPGLFRDQVFLVTGGGSGIGRCVAHEAAALGGTVVLAGRTEALLALTRREIESYGGRASFVVMDVRDADSVDAGVTRLLERHGRLDAVVNSAGGQFHAATHEMSVNGWRSVVDLNLTGSFIVATAAHRHWLSAHGGSLVFIGGMVRNGLPHVAHTGAAKAALSNLARTLAVEWGHGGVRANVVAPGVVNSSGMDTYPEERQAHLARLASGAPAGRAGTESEISAAVVFLLSPAARFITGETLLIDGGLSLTGYEIVPRPPTAADEVPAFDGFHLARTGPVADHLKHGG